jgi:hypothetical protein
MLNLQTVLSALPRLMPLVGQAEAVGNLVHEIVGSFGHHDQETLKAEIAKLADENDAGHARLQEKLRAVS